MVDGKITLPDGKWLKVLLIDDIHGKPAMTVAREVEAVMWMRNEFEAICDSVPGW